MLLGGVAGHSFMEAPPCPPCPPCPLPPPPPPPAPLPVVGPESVPQAVTPRAAMTIVAAATKMIEYLGFTELVCIAAGAPAPRMPAPDSSHASWPLWRAQDFRVRRRHRATQRLYDG